MTDVSGLFSLIPKEQIVRKMLWAGWAENWIKEAAFMREVALESRNVLMKAFNCAWMITVCWHTESL